MLWEFLAITRSFDLGAFQAFAVLMLVFVVIPVLLIAAYRKVEDRRDPKLPEISDDEAARWADFDPSKE